MKMQIQITRSWNQGATIPYELIFCFEQSTDDVSAQVAFDSAIYMISNYTLVSYSQDFAKNLFGYTSMLIMNKHTPHETLYSVTTGNGDDVRCTEIIPNIPLYTDVDDKLGVMFMRDDPTIYNVTKIIVKLINKICNNNAVNPISISLKRDTMVCKHEW